MAVAEMGGLDGSGKTSQIALFEVDRTGLAVPRNPEAFPNLSGPDLADWWFGEATPNDLARSFAADAHYADDFIETNEKERALLLVDRGPAMHLAAIVATAMTTERCGFDSAISSTHPIYERHLGYDPLSGDHPAYWLSPDNEYAAKQLPRSMHHRPSAKKASLFTAEQDEIYHTYQNNLAVATQNIVAIRPNVHTLTVDDAQLPIQNRLRRVAGEVQNLSLPSLAKNLRLIVGFSGMSESGKSTMAEYMRTDRGAYRLKLGFFNRFGGGKPLKDDELARAVLGFADDHYYVPEFTVESIHSDGLAKALQRLLGRQGAIAYCDADPKIREARHLQQSLDNTADSFSAKDAVKAAKGADRVAEIADIVLDTSGPSERAIHELAQFVTSRIAQPTS
jgi:hypothetical protein